MKTILLIEDNHQVRENIGEILELAGYSVLSAENGKVGVGVAKADDVEPSDVEEPTLFKMALE